MASHTRRQTVHGVFALTVLSWIRWGTSIIG